VPSLVTATPCANLADSNPFSSADSSSRHFSEGLRSVVPAVVEKIDSFIQPRPDDVNAFLTQLFSTHRSRTGQHRLREPLELRTPHRFQSESRLASTHIPNLAAARQAIRIRSARVTVCPSSDVFRSEGPNKKSALHRPLRQRCVCAHSRHWC
jgi:hypothetical protein